MVGVWEGLEMEGVAVRHPTDVAAAVGKNWGASGDQGESEMSAEPPMLVGDPVLAVLRCRLMTDGGDNGLVRVRNDHVMVLGEVLEILAQDAGNGDGDGVNGETVLGLAYADRRYRAPGTVIEKHVP